MTSDARIALTIVIVGMVGIFILLLVFAGWFGPRMGGERTGAPWQKTVARIDLKGDIYQSEAVVDEIRRWAKDGSVRSLLIYVDSPGGGVAASQEIYEELRRVRDGGKPVVAYFGSLAASGGYYVALGANQIVASPGTLTGSIGVIMTLPNTQELMRKIGIDMDVVKSGEHKDLGSLFRPMSEEERRILQDLIDDSYDQFVSAVAENRGLGVDSVLAMADGRVFTGRQALELGLVDRLGTYRDAVDLAGELAGLGPEPTVVQKKQPRNLLRELVGVVFGPGERALSAASGPRLEYRLAW